MNLGRHLHSEKLNKPLHELTLVELAHALQSDQTTSVAVTEAYLDRIEKYDERINSYVYVNAEGARAAAQASDQRRKKDETRGILDGIPYNLKDVYATKGNPTTASSKMLDGWIAPYNATVYTILEDAGAVLLGKTNTDEFTMGVSTETSYQGVTRNPWDLERVSGGSSGGPAASVAAQLAVFSIGTDTGGSIRQPAAFCGVTGVRPTYGRISRFGEIAMASSLDQTGPITRTAEDAAILTQILSGSDPLDATSSPMIAPLAEDSALTLPGTVPVGASTDKRREEMRELKPLIGLKIGIAKEYFGEGLQPEVEVQVKQAIQELVGLGASTIEVSLPAVPHALAAYYIIAPAEVSSNMARYDGIRFGHSIEKTDPHTKRGLHDSYVQSRSTGLGHEVQRRMMLGSYVLSAGHFDAYYQQAEAVRQTVQSQFAEVFETVDVLLAPVSPHTAFKVGEKISDPLAMYKEDILTVPLNIGGIPGMSIPCGLVNNLPVGLQIMAARGDEVTMFRTARAYQLITDFHQQFAQMIAPS
jgi:aspartyl-tRNA(Asn)/glutamyl-tRNA(Gln) amidotransferase subunit A